jgi:hypothetical protein
MPDPSLHHERLLPGWGAWVVAAGLVGMISVAYGAALGSMAGLAVALVAGALVTALLVGTSPVVRVDESSLRAGRARLPRTSVSGARVLDREALMAQRTPGSDARVYTLLRPWATSRAVLVILDDPEDPHPAWIVSSRHPDRLAGALTATMGSPAEASDTEESERP